MLHTHVEIVGQVRAESKLTKKNFSMILNDCCKNNKLNLKDDLTKALDKLTLKQSDYFKTRMGWDNKKPISFIKMVIYHHRMGIYAGRKFEYNIVKNLRDELRELVLDKTNIRI